MKKLLFFIIGCIIPVLSFSIDSDSLNRLSEQKIIELEERTELLEQKISAISVKDTINQNDVELISTAKEFYLEAWNNIKFFILLCIALAGIMLPLWIYFWQRTIFKQEILSQTHNFKEEIRKDYDKKINDLECENDGVNSFSFALHNVDEGNTTVGLYFYFSACERLLRVEKYASARNAIGNTITLLKGRPIPVYRTHLAEAFKKVLTFDNKHLSSAEEFINELRNLDVKGAVNKDINELEEALNSVPEK